MRSFPACTEWVELNLRKVPAGYRRLPKSGVCARRRAKLDRTPPLRGSMNSGEGTFTHGSLAIGSMTAPVSRADVPGAPPPPIQGGAAIARLRPSLTPTPVSPKNAMAG